MKQNKMSKYFKYAIGEILLVVIGILIAVQINNWNENRKDRVQEKIILKNLQSDLRADIKRIKGQTLFQDSIINRYNNALSILAEKKEGTLAELKSDLQSILQVGGLRQNKTTFNNLESSGEIRLIQNKELTDKITKYYNNGYEGWQSALRDYTRNITAPYFLQFDHFPKFEYTDLTGRTIKMPMEPADFKLKERTLDDYKNNYFIINMLRQKTYNLIQLRIQFLELAKYANELDEKIQHHIDHS